MTPAAAVDLYSTALLYKNVTDQFSDADGLQLLAGFKVDDSAMLQVNLLLVIAVGVVGIGSNAAVAMGLRESKFNAVPRFVDPEFSILEADRSLYEARGGLGGLAALASCENCCV